MKNLDSKYNKFPDYDFMKSWDVDDRGYNDKIIYDPITRIFEPITDINDIYYVDTTPKDHTMVIATVITVLGTIVAWLVNYL